MGCFINPFSDYQLYSYSEDCEIRLWDTLDGGCMKVLHVKNAIGLLDVIPHPTIPDMLFLCAVTSRDRDTYWKILQYDVKFPSRPPLTHRTESSESLWFGKGEEVHMAARAIDPSEQRADDGCFLVFAAGKTLQVYNSTSHAVFRCFHVDAPPRRNA